VTDPTKPKFAWSGTGFVARASGTSISVSLENDDAYFFQAVVDGKKGTRFQAAKGTATREIASGLASGVHTVELYRETEGSYGVSQFLGVAQGGLMDPPP